MHPRGYFSSFDFRDVGLFSVFRSVFLFRSKIWRQNGFLCNFEHHCRFLTNASPPKHTLRAKQVSPAHAVQKKKKSYCSALVECSRITGLESSVSNTALYPVSGIRITMNGFHDKMHVLVDAFAAVLCRMSMTQVLRAAIHGKRCSVAVYKSPVYRRSLILFWKFSKSDTRRGNLRDRTSPPHTHAA
jgi:hypothetical protein